jgi:hypothetical protein
MKRLLFILMTLLVNLNVGYGQTNVYHPFSDSNVVWAGNSGYGIGGGPCVVDYNYNLFISGDTLIGAFLYHKLYRNAYTYSSCPPPGAYYYGVYSGAFRQDVLSKKVYLFENDADTLAYDFDLNVGDTLPKTCLNELTDNYVESIDSVLVGSQYRKRFWISCSAFSNYTALIESIGTTLGVFTTIQPPPIGGWSDLWCVRVNNEIVWNSIEGSTCSLLSVADDFTTNKKMLISKNPFSIETTLTFDFKNATLTIYNSSGQLVKQLKDISDQTVVLQRDNLGSGVYFVQLMQENKVIAMNKLIVIDN